MGLKVVLEGAGAGRWTPARLRSKALLAEETARPALNRWGPRRPTESMPCAGSSRSHQRSGLPAAVTAGSLTELHPAFRQEKHSSMATVTNGVPATHHHRNGVLVHLGAS